MTIKRVHDWIYFLLDKAKAGYHSHEEIDQALDSAQLDVFNEFFGNPKTFDPGRPVARVSYGEHQAVNKVLSPFKKQIDFLPQDTPAGLLTLPDDFVHPLGAYTIVYSNALGRSLKRPVAPVNEDELIKRLESQMVPVTLTDPIAIYNNKSMQLFPEQPQTGRLYYLRRPAVPSYVYTTTSRVETHDAGSSQDLEWDDVAVGHVVAKALVYLGANLSSELVLQFGDMKDKQGS